jgi:hypothetical protein
MRLFKKFAGNMLFFFPERYLRTKFFYICIAFEENTRPRFAAETSALKQKE